MSNTNKKVAKTSRQDSQKVSIIAIVAFELILLLLIPNTAGLCTEYGNLQTVFLYILAPLVLPELCCSYGAGLTVSKITHIKWKKGRLTSILTLFIMNIISIALCFGIEFAMNGYRFPLTECVNVCVELNTIDVVVMYTATATGLFLPAYCATLFYGGWRDKKRKKKVDFEW